MICAGVITVSGDGLLHEFLNGVMEVGSGKFWINSFLVISLSALSKFFLISKQRADWREVISRVGFSVIAAGSGNGLAAEVHLLDPVSSAFTIAKGFWRPMDLMYTSQDGQVMRNPFRPSGSSLFHFSDNFFWRNSRQGGVFSA